MPESMQSSKIFRKSGASFDSGCLMFDIFSLAAISARENEFTTCFRMKQSLGLALGADFYLLPSDMSTTFLDCTWVMASKAAMALRLARLSSCA